MHVQLPNKGRVPIEHEHWRPVADVPVADVTTQGARVVQFLHMRACCNQNTKLHMHTFRPHGGTAWIIGK